MSRPRTFGANARFAIYFAPDVTTSWWQAGCAWLGRDAYSGEPREQPRVGALPCDLASLTGLPRRYGWHGTLVAPFRRAAGVTAADVLGATRVWASRQRPFMLEVEPATLGDFVALRPRHTNGARQIETLATDALRSLHALREEPSRADMERRLQSPLTERQRALLLEWGYPYVLDEFRFHMTLSDSLDAVSLRQTLQDWWQDRTAELGPLFVDRAAIFVEPEPGAPFVLWQTALFQSRGSDQPMPA